MKLVKTLAVLFVVLVVMSTGMVVMSGLDLPKEGAPEVYVEVAAYIVIISTIIGTGVLTGVMLQYFDEKLEQQLEETRKKAAYHGAQRLYRLMCDDPRINKVLLEDIPIFSKTNEEIGTHTSSGAIADIIRKEF